MKSAIDRYKKELASARISYARHAAYILLAYISSVILSFSFFILASTALAAAFMLGALYLSYPLLIATLTVVFFLRKKIESSLKTWCCAAPLITTVCLFLFNDFNIILLLNALLCSIIAAILYGLLVSSTLKKHNAKHISITLIAVCTAIPLFLASNYLLYKNSSATVSPIAPNEIEGVYKNSFANSDISGDKYTSENILEITEYSKDSIYFRTHLEFYNGHVCDIWGIAARNADGFIYRKPVNAANNNACTLAIKQNAHKIVLDDVGGECRRHSCGSRGGYSNISFDIDTKRKIKYLDKIKQSLQYKEAITEYTQHNLDQPERKAP